MTPPQTRLQQVMLSALYYSGICKLLEPVSAGVGMIFMLHHVVAEAPRAFAPNRGLEIDADFLDLVLQEVRRRGFRIVDLDEVERCLRERDFDSKFACFTFDDGYQDNFEHALPVFKRHDAPFALYLTSGLPDGTAVLWWRVLEYVIANNDSVEVPGMGPAFQIRTTREKYRAYQSIYWPLRNAHPDRQSEIATKLGERYGVGAEILCSECAVSWPRLNDMLETGLVTIGAHTVNHRKLSDLDTEEARTEIVRGCDTTRERLQITPRHLAYPYGDRASAASREFQLARELGFATAVTTRKGVLYPDHAEYLHALPRVSLNGFFQHAHYLRALMSGAPFALRRGFVRLDTS